MPQFSVGDIVRLKSGGPDMTITGHSVRVALNADDFDVSVAWFDKHVAIGCYTFPETALQLAPESTTRQPVAADNDDLPF